MADRPTPGRRLVEVAPGVLVATATLWSTTSTVVIDGSEALVVDPAASATEVAGLAAAITERGPRVTAGFSTHPHWDHLLWHRDLGDAPRWATARAAAEVARDVDAPRRRAEEEEPGHDLTLVGGVTPLEPGATGLPWPRRRDGTGVRVVEHDAHAPGHAALVVSGVLVAGDMLSDAEVPLVDVDCPDPVGTYRRGLELLELAAQEVGVLVPGHGRPARGRAEIAARFRVDRAYLDAFERATTDPRVTVPDDRLHGYVADWHAEQLTALRR